MPNLCYIQRTGCNYGSRCVTKQIHVLSSRGKVWQRRSKVELSVWHNDWVAKNDLRNQENKFSKHTFWNMLYLVKKEFCCVFLCINAIVKNESSIFLKEGGTINRTIPHGGTVSLHKYQRKKSKKGNYSVETSSLTPSPPPLNLVMIYSRGRHVTEEGFC